MAVEVDGVTLAGRQLAFYQRFSDEHINQSRRGTPENQALWCVLGLSGTGKTVLLRAINNALRNELGEQSCLATAYAATASKMIGAKTINSTFLLAWNGEDDNANQRAVNRMNAELRGVKVLLIDNINYVDAKTFVAINNRFQIAKNNERPFGGISVICFGDFYQQKQLNKPSIYADTADNAESRRLWQQFKLFELTENHRFETNEEWEIVQAIALGGPTDATVGYLRDHCQMVGGTADDVADQLNQLRAEGGRFAVIAPTNPMIGNVQDILNAGIENKTFRRLPVMDNINFFESRDFRPSDNTDIPVTVSRGCSVILTINHRNGIRHGTMGIVEGWDDDEDTIFVRFEGRANAVRITRVGWYYGREGWYQFPLLVIEDVYNYQMSQGLSLDGVIVVRKLAWNGQAHLLNQGEFYSAISRARSLKNCRITPLDLELNWTVSAGANDEMDRLREANNQE